MFALEESSVAELAQPTVGRYSRPAADELSANPGDPADLAPRGYHNERLDQLVTELVTGAG